MKTSGRDVFIPLGSVQLQGILQMPQEAKAIVIFSHGSGSSRFSPRNTFVAGVLNEAGIATLLIDLLTPEEDNIYENRFDIGLLTRRLVAVTSFIHQHEKFKDLSIGYFGASTGAASAINAAAILSPLIGAIVSRGGRPDLAQVDFVLLKAPTLLIVGGLDGPVIGMNEEVYRELQCEKEIVIVQGATHLFEEAGKLEEVARLAAEWFRKFLLKNEEHKTKQFHHDV